MRLHTPLQRLREARQIAVDYGMDVTESKTAKGETVYRLHRKVDGCAVWLGQRKSPDGIRSLVCKHANFR